LRAKLLYTGSCAGAHAAGWLRSEMMLDAYEVTDDNWRTATAPPGFAVAEAARQQFGDKVIVRDVWEGALSVSDRVNMS
jgi:hypothetical protein